FGPAPCWCPAPQGSLAQPVGQRIRNAWVGCSSHPGGTSLAKQGNTGRRGPHSRELRRLKAAVARDKEDELRIPIHRQGWPFIVLGVGFNALLILWLGWWGLVATPVVLWIISFFRDPDRAPPLGEGLIVSPADGILLPVAQAPPPPDLGLGPEVRTRLSIFMTFFHVHVNRIPETGTIEALPHKAGQSPNAALDKATDHQERLALGLRLGTGQAGVIMQSARL